MLFKKGVHNFPKGISSKANIIAPLSSNSLATMSQSSTFTTMPQGLPCFVRYDTKTYSTCNN